MALAAVSDPETDELFEMANLSPRTTGLPFTVWAGPRGHAQHGPRIKVSLTPGSMDIGDTVAVAIRPKPRLIEGDCRLVAAWIALNEDALIDLWNEAIDAVELCSRLKKIETEGNGP